MPLREEVQVRLLLPKSKLFALSLLLSLLACTLPALAGGVPVTSRARPLSEMPMMGVSNLKAGLSNGIECGNNPINAVDPMGTEWVPLQVYKDDAFRQGQIYPGLSPAQKAWNNALDHFERTKNSSGTYYIEALVLAPAGKFSSSWGHNATFIGGTAFSMGQNGMSVLPKQEYLGINTWRDGTGYRIKINEEQYLNALQELYMMKELNPNSFRLRNYRPWNDCATASCRGMNATGLEMTTDWWATPAELEAQLKEIPGVEVINYPKTTK